jgi:biotin transport system substrate-specific component
MTTAALSSSKRRSSFTTAAGVVGFAAAVAAASQIAIPLPGTPVPFTLQPMLVVLAGIWLGPAAGLASMVLYLTAGALGLPVFTPIGAPGCARLVGPTGGYLVAYPAAAYVAGAISRRSDSFRTRWLAAIAGVAVIYLGGLAQLSVLSGGLVRAVQLGVTPFAALDMVKTWIAAALTAPKTMHRVG